MLTHAELKFAIRKAIEIVGIDALKRTSMFMSNNTASTSIVEESKKKAA